MASCVAVLALTGAVLVASYFYDNKYAITSPRGEDAEFAFRSDELDRPLVLTDGWMMELEGAPARETFIGQYSNFSHVPGNSSPDGRAVYTITLRALDADGPVALTMFVPEVFGDYELLVDGRLAAWRGSGPFVGLVVDGEAELRFVVDSSDGYYSGLVYPPIAGTAQVMGEWQALRTAASGAACLVPLVLATVACAVWAPRRADPVLALFSALCLCLSIASFGPFAWQLGWSGPWQHAVEDACWTAALSCAAAMATQAAGLWSRPWCRRAVLPVLGAAPLTVFALVGVAVPSSPSFIEVNEAFQTVFRIAAWALVVGSAVAGARSHALEAPYLLCASVVLALAFLSNLLDAGSFEPLYGLWQSEYAGLAAMAVFAAMIAARGRRLVAQEAAARETAVQLRAAELTIAHIRASEDATRAMRHDLKHHANALAALAEAGAWDRARAYAHGLEEGLSALAPVRFSENLVANAVCAAHLAPAAEQGVEVRCDVRLPAELPLRDEDLAVLLANLLSNAVEGCLRAPEGRPRALRFDASWDGEALCLRCENTAPEESRPVRTSKRDTDDHGFGLPSMRAIAKRCNGAVTLERTEGKVVVRCVLRPERDKDGAIVSFRAESPGIMARENHPFG